MRSASFDTHDALLLTLSRGEPSLSLSLSLSTKRGADETLSSAARAGSPVLYAAWRTLRTPAAERRERRETGISARQRASPGAVSRGPGTARHLYPAAPPRKGSRRPSRSP